MLSIPELATERSRVGNLSIPGLATERSRVGNLSIPGLATERSRVGNCNSPVQFPFANIYFHLFIFSGVMDNKKVLFASR